MHQQTTKKKLIEPSEIEERSPDQLVKELATAITQSAKDCKEYFTVNKVAKTMKCNICWASKNKSKQWRS
jgi:hypothetical protein